VVVAEHVEQTGGAPLDWGGSSCKRCTFPRVAAQLQGEAVCASRSSRSASLTI